MLSSIPTFVTTVLLLCPGLALAVPPLACQPNFQGGPITIRNAASGNYWSLDNGANVGSLVKAGSSPAAFLFQNNGQYPAAYGIRESTVQLPTT